MVMAKAIISLPSYLLGMEGSDPSVWCLLGRTRFSVAAPTSDTVFITMENEAQENSGWASVIR